MRTIHLLISLMILIMNFNLIRASNRVARYGVRTFAKKLQLTKEDLLFIEEYERMKATNPDLAEQLLERRQNEDIENYIRKEKGVDKDAPV